MVHEAITGLLQLAAVGPTMAEEGWEGISKCLLLWLLVPRNQGLAWTQVRISAILRAQCLSAAPVNPVLISDTANRYWLLITENLKKTSFPNLLDLIA